MTSSPNYQSANAFSAFGSNNHFNLTGGKQTDAEPRVQIVHSLPAKMCVVSVVFSVQWNESPKAI